MKKIVYFLIFVAITIVIFAMMYINYKSIFKNIMKDNLQFEYYNQKEVSGADIATLINKAVDSNIKFNVDKDSNGKYIENSENSIKIQIYIADYDKTYDMETFYNGGIDRFVQNYGDIKFKCTQIDYHETSKRIKKVYFRQVVE